MSGKGTVDGNPAPSGSNVLLYMGPHTLANSANPKNTGFKEERHCNIQNVDEKEMGVKDGVENMTSMHYPPVYSEGVVSKETPHPPNILSIENGMPMPPGYTCKSIIDPGNNATINCIPNVMNNSFVGIQNIADGQRVIQRDSYPNIIKVNDKLINGHMLPGSICANSFIDQSQNNGKIISLSQVSERSESDIGDQSTNIPTRENHIEAQGNILVMPGQMQQTIHQQQTPNQILINSNANILTRVPSGNILISNVAGSAENSSLANFQMINASAMNQHRNQQISGQGMSVVNSSNVCVRSDQVQHSSGPKDIISSGCFDNSNINGSVVNNGDVRPNMEGDIVIVNDVAHHVVRTPSGGLVLGMLPRPRQQVQGPCGPLPVPSEGVNVIHGDSGNFIGVPSGWSRVLQGSNICYISPSGAILCSLDQVRDYLQSAGTCKCGLDCPLRPEAVFNFDPKVMSKPNDMAGLTKMGDAWRGCAGKRRAGPLCPPSPSFTPPSPTCSEEKKQQMNVDCDLPSAKKRKRKTNPYSGVSVSQLLAQRENVHQQQIQGQQQQQQQQQQGIPNQQHLQQIHQHPGLPNQPSIQQMPGLQQQLAWIHSHNINPNMPHPCESGSPTVGQMKFSNVSPEPGVASRNMVLVGDNSRNTIVQGSQPQIAIKSDDSSNSTSSIEIQPNGRKHIGPQILTVNGNVQGCVMPDQRQIQRHVILNSNQHPDIQPDTNRMSGHNGDAVSVQESKISSESRLILESEGIPNSRNPAVYDNNSKDNEVQRNPNNSIQIISNGLVVSPSQNTNQPQGNTISIADFHNLPPEVIERINQQQQIFIQQNQKQMELAMKSIKNHNVPGSVNAPTLEMKPNQNDMQTNRMVISNTMIIPNNNNQRVPPWQLNRGNMQPISQNRPIPNTYRNNTQIIQNQFSNTPQNVMNQGYQKNPIGNPTEFGNSKCENDNIYSRVPPLHHDYPPTVWPEKETVKKTKVSRGNKKDKGHDNQTIATKVNQTITVPPANHSPQCIEDPSGYLAQQAAYMSRQLGMVHMMNPCEDIKTSKNSPRAFNSRNNSNNNPNETINISNRMVHNSPSQCNLPDSSMNSDKSNDNSKHSHCQGCIAEMNKSKSNSSIPYQTKIKNYIDSLVAMKSESLSQSGTPSPNQCSDDSPVTSSTYGDRPGSRSNNIPGPIQGRIISTSNGSPMEGYLLPELSPTPSNSSRNTDTPQSKTSNNAFNISSSCPYPNSSPAYSYQGSSRESVNSNPATPSPGNASQNYSAYSSPEPTSNVTNQLPLGSANNKNDIVRGMNMPMNNTNNCPTLFANPNNGNAGSDCPPVGTLPNNFNNQRIQANQNGPFTFFMSSTGNQNVGNPSISLSNEIVTTVAGHTLIRNTITSVLAGKAQTATTSINGSASGMPQLYPPIANPSAIIHRNNTSLSNSSNLPSNYPLHIAGSVVQSLVTKSPLEMVQNVISNINISQSQNNSQINTNRNNIQEKHHIPNPNAHQAVLSGNNQILISGPVQGNVMAPPPPKSQTADTSVSTTPTSTTITQGISAVGGVPQVINHPTVLVNTIPGPFMLQPQMVTVDGQVVNQNVQVPQIVAGNILPQGQIIDGNNAAKSPGSLNRPALLSPDGGKKKGKKKKPPSPVASVVQMPAPHNSSNLLVQQNSQQTQQFVSQGFQVSPNGNISTTPMLQALTIVPGKGGAPAHIVMNGQAAGNFGSQQIINSQGPQHINLLQPVNLINGPTGVVQNFPTFQQFIVPGLGSMVMTADGTAILQDPSSMSMQLQIQNVNGQNVLTPVQNQGILTAGPAGMVIRTQNPNNKMMQSQHSPGAQFLSPSGGQIVMSGSPFNGQLSPLIAANVSPNQTVTFNNSPPQVRSNMQQEFLQCNQMGQALMLPVSPNQIAVSSSSNQQNATFVQQNTTIVQQQTTMVANNQGQYQNVNRNAPSNSTPILNVEHGVVVNQVNKQHNQMKEKVQNNMPTQIQQITVQTSNNENSAVKRLAVPFTHLVSQNPQMNTEVKNNEGHNMQQMFSNLSQNNVNNQDLSMLNPNFRNTVSTQTLLNQQQTGNKSPIQPYSNQSSGASPPDTTTHSPLGSLDGFNGSPANSFSGRSPSSVHGNQVDTTTGSPEPVENNSLAMVQCVSSSEPDSMDSNNWGKTGEKPIEMQVEIVNNQNNASPQRQNNFYSVDSSGIHFKSQTITVSSLNNQQNLTITPANYYEKNNISKTHVMNSMTVISGNNMDMNAVRMIDKNKNDNRNMLNKLPPNYFTTDKQPLHSINNMNQINLQRTMENVNSNNFNRRFSGTDESTMEVMNVPTNQTNHQPENPMRQFKEGDLVWGPAKGHPAWPGKLVTKNRINGKEDGKVLVRWFGGDKCLTVLDSSNLQTLSEGLEAHHAARTKCRKSRKLNSQLEKAIQEAMAELDRITESNEIAKDQYNEIKSEEMMVEDADINGNSSKSLMKSITRNGNNKTVSEFVSKNESKAKWSNKRESKTRAGSGVVKIAPHPGSVNTNVTAKPSGRLRSSQR